MQQDRSEIEFFKQTRVSKKKGGHFVNDAAKEKYVRKSIHLDKYIFLLYFLVLLCAHEFYQTGRDGSNENQMY